MIKKMSRRHFLIASAASLAALAGCGIPRQEQAAARPEYVVVPLSLEESDPSEKVVRTEEEWKEILTPEQYRVLREQGTERAFTGRYHDFKDQGTYHCAACGNPLFSSEAKYDSGTGWPSYWETIAEGRVKEEADQGFGMVRTEVLCNRCDSHLGHVFPDGPPPTGLRYCINSVALQFAPADAAVSES